MEELSVSICRAGVFLVWLEEQLHYVCVTALNHRTLTTINTPESSANVQTYRNIPHQRPVEASMVEPLSSLTPVQTDIEMCPSVFFHCLSVIVRLCCWFHRSDGWRWDGDGCGGTVALHVAAPPPPCSRSSHPASQEAIVSKRLKPKSLLVFIDAQRWKTWSLIVDFIVINNSVIGTGLFMTWTLKMLHLITQVTMFPKNLIFSCYSWRPAPVSVCWTRMFLWYRWQSLVYIGATCIWSECAAQYLFTLRMMMMSLLSAPLH